MHRLTASLPAVAIAVAAATVGLVARAATPASGSVSAAHPAVTWTNSLPMSGSAPAVRRITCNVPTTCDDFALSVDRGTSTDTILDLALTPGAGASMVFVVYAPGCPVSPTSSCYSDGGTKTSMLNPANGAYTVRVSCTTCAAASYTMTATLGHRSPPRAAAQAFTSSFGAPQSLKPPGAVAGEPGLASDGHGNIVVVSLTGAPAIAGGGTTGIPTWVSHDNGKTWTGSMYGSFLGGWDTDVAVEPDTGNFFIADLEVAATQICRSTDHGSSFNAIGLLPDPLACTTINLGQAGPSNDRQWLTPAGNGRLYLTYHEFYSGYPLMFRSDNEGADLFTAGPCGPIVTDPGIATNILAPGVGGTLVSRPVVDKAGNVYVLFNTPTVSQGLAALPGTLGGTVSQIYVAVSNDGCASWTDHLVFDGSALGTNSVQFGDIFNNLAVDGGGNLYSVAAGYVGGTKPNPATADIFIASSTDHGVTWTKVRKLNTDVGAHMLPAVVGGPKAGQVAIGYYRTINGVTNPNDPGGQWTYTAAESSNATAGDSASFLFGDVNPSHIYHAADICNSGIFCGLPVPGAGSNRALADFTSVITLNGCPMYVFAQDSQLPETIDVARQSSNCFGASAAAVSASTTGAPPVQAPSTAAPVAGSPNTAARVPAPGAAIAGLLIGVAAAAVGRRRRMPAS